VNAEEPSRKMNYEKTLNGPILTEVVSMLLEDKNLAARDAGTLKNLLEHSMKHEIVSLTMEQWQWFEARLESAPLRVLSRIDDNLRGLMFNTNRKTLH
jgi:hypothetical protein